MSKENSFSFFRSYINLLRDIGSISSEVHDVLFRFGLYMCYCDTDEECISCIREYLLSHPASIQLSDISRFVGGIENE